MKNIRHFNEKIFTFILVETDFGTLSAFITLQGVNCRCEERERLVKNSFSFGLEFQNSYGPH